MKPVQIAENIYSVGVIDWNIRDFHGYSTKEGTTYNAFLIIDEKITLIDTVKKEFVPELIENISKIVDPAKIDYVISNHTEMDHSGGLPLVMDYVGKDKPVFCSKKGQENLSRHFFDKLNLKVVEDGSSMKIGKRELLFLETRMLHWPDSMFTYDKTDKILFSSDAFGQHYASFERFDDQADIEMVMQQAKKYFANILLLYAPLILKLVEKVTSLGLEFNMICPDHGILWRKDISRIINAYVEWSTQKPAKKAVVVYDTMWHSTGKMAEAIAAGLADSGVQTRVMHIRDSHRSDIMTEVLDAAVVVVGSPTLNNGLFPTVSDLLTYMKGLKPKNKVAAAFGSYGWSGEAVKLIHQEFEAMKFDIIDSGLNIMFVPDKKVIDECYNYGVKISHKVL